MALRDSLRLLVVDDMATSRGLLVQTLESLGLTHIETASSTREALELLGTTPVHLVLSDLNMPGRSGLDLLAAMRRDSEIAATGFVLISGRMDAGVLDAGQRLGMNNFLAKPFTAHGLRAAIEAVVGRI